MNLMKWMLGSVLTLALGACGGGGSDGGSNPPPVTPPSALSYPAPPTFTKSTAITALTPTVTGSVTAYSVAPALPAGLALNTATGAISGTPTAVQAGTTHTITASNAGGSTTAGVSITVNDVVPSITYPRGAYNLTTGSAVTAIAPAATGGTVVSWAISGAMPAGLAFNTSNGQITGTPTAVTAAANHTVTATNSGGTDTFDLSIGVQSGVLLELGHVTAIKTLAHNGTRVMSTDDFGRVSLFDSANGSIIVSSGPTCDLTTCGSLANLSGPTFVIRKLTGFDVYNAQTGSLLASIASPSSVGSKWKIATDGSYFVTWSPTGLNAWSSSGTSLVTRAGNYTTANVFAAAAEIRIANGPGTPQRIEKISVPGAVSSTTSTDYLGTFHNWFADGDRFLTRANNTVVVYTHAGVQEDTATLTTLDSLNGTGNWFWSRTQAFPSILSLYAVGAGGTAAATFTVDSGSPLVPSGNTLGVVNSSNIGVIDLSLATPTRTVYPTSAGTNAAYAATSPTNAAYGSLTGVVLGSLTAAQPVRYSYGRARSIAGGSSRVAIATDSGDVLYFNAVTLTLEGTLHFPSSKVLLSADGNVLAAMASEGHTAAPYRAVRVYSLPSETLLKEWTWPATGAGNATVSNISLSSAGDIVGQVLSEQIGLNHNLIRRVVRYDDTVVWTDTIAGGYDQLSFRLSPSGTRVGASNDWTPLPTSGTNIYLNAGLTGALAGWPAGWIDESRLLVNRYVAGGSLNSPTSEYNGCVIVSPTGTVLASPALPQVGAFQPVDANSIYSPGHNMIIDVNTGDTVWSTNSAGGGGAVAGGYVVFNSPLTVATVRAEPR